MSGRVVLGSGLVALAVIASAAALEAASAAASGDHPADAWRSTRSAPAAQVAPPARGCVAQRDNDSGVAIVSQSFEAPAAIFDARGADDFILSSRCRVRTVAVDGVYLNGSGPAVSVNVTFYRGRATPRTVTADDSDASYRDADGTGSFVVTAAAKLGIGHGWVSVQANMDFSSGGEWGWLTNTTIRGRASQWENPDDGYGTGCTVYTTTTTCIAAGEGGDFSFAIN